MRPAGDTIAAIATPPGRGGVAIVRVSGPLTDAIAAAVQVRTLRPRVATATRFLDAAGAVIDTGIALRFEMPHSFTGEDVLELHCHGGVAVSRALLSRVCELGARPAEPGEFTFRAYLNDRIDLLQAEAVADLIDAGTAFAVRSAARLLTGEFSARVGELVDSLVSLRVFIEAAIDFPDEEIDLLNDSDVGERVRAVHAECVAIRGSAERGAVLREGVVVAIVGAPNVGKSSLMNRITRVDAAIVTDTPGTTRDTIRESVVIGGLMANIVDTAGLRPTDDPVESAGIERARATLASADVVVHVVDAREDVDEAAIASRASCARVLTIRNKRDLAGETTGWTLDEPDHATVTMSALHDPDIVALEQALEQCLVGATDDHVYLARQRHLDGLADAVESLESACRRFELDRAGELIAEDLRAAQRALESLTGRFTTEDLLDRIFSSFCIGK